MPVLIDYQTVIVRRQAIDEKVAGGMAQFVSAIPNRMGSVDSDLVAVCLMSGQDVSIYTGHLRAMGLEALRDSRAADWVVYDCFRGPACPAPWLRIEKQPVPGSDIEVQFAALDGTSDDRKVVPSAWRIDHSAYASEDRDRSSPPEELTFLRSEGKIDVFWHKRRGHEVYVGRTYPGPPADPDDDKRARQLFESAFELTQRSGAHRLVPPAKLGWFARRQATEAVKKFNEAFELRPQQWAPAFWMGKCQQSLGLLKESLDAFGRAWMLQPSNADIAREASISAMVLEQHDVAIYYANEALRLQPEGEGLQSNLALAHLFAGNLQAAAAAADAALAAEPDHPSTQFLHTLVHEVQAGRMPRPRRDSEIDHAAVERAMPG